MAQDEALAEKEAIRALYARAEIQGLKPCLECCAKRGPTGFLEVENDSFFMSTTLGRHTKRVHRKIYKRGIRCGKCGCYFSTQADLDSHVQIMPKDH